MDRGDRPPSVAPVPGRLLGPGRHGAGRGARVRAGVRDVSDAYCERCGSYMPMTLAGDYCIVAAWPLVVDGVQMYKNGTVVLTLKPAHQEPSR